MGVGAGRTSGESTNSNLLAIGRGILFFDEEDPADATKTLGQRDLGNIPAFKLTTNQETLAHFSSRAGLKTQDKLVILSSTLTASWSCDEVNNDNVALFLMGTQTPGNPINTGATAPGAGAGNFHVHELNRWYPLRGSGATLTTADTTTIGWYIGGQGIPTDLATVKFRRYNINTSTITVANTGGTPYTSGTHYKVNGQFGLLYIVNGFGDSAYISRDSIIDVTFSQAGSNFTPNQVNILKQTTFRGRLVFIGENSVNGKKFEMVMHRCNVTPDGDMGLIGSEFAQISFTASAEAVPTINATAPTGYIRVMP